MKRTFIPLMLCIAFGLLLAACGGSDSSNTTSNTTTTNTSTSNTTKTTPPASNTGTSTTSNTTTTTTTSSGEKIGIAECDEFIAKYEACINSKVPEAQRATYKPMIDQWRSSWRNLANNPQTKSTLAGVCKNQLEQTKTSMKSFGCEF